MKDNYIELYIIMFQLYIKKHITTSAIVLFLLIIYIIHYFKPQLIYNQDDTFKSFGLGYRNKTVVPMWLICIVIAIISYISVHYYLSTPEMIY